jgi:hypothetical protein
MLLGLSDLVTGTKELLPLVPPLVEVFRKLQSQGQSPTTLQALHQMRLDSIESCQKLRMQLTQAIHDLPSIGVNIDQSLSLNYQRLSWFSNFPSKVQLAAQRRRIRQVHLQLSSASDELASMLVCAGSADGVGAAYQRAMEVRRYVDGLALDEGISIRDLLLKYASIVDGYIMELQGP